MAAVTALDALREIEEDFKRLVSPCELDGTVKAKFDVVRKSLNVLFLMDVGIDKLRRKADIILSGLDEDEAEKAEEAEPEEQAGAPPEEATQGDAKRAKTAE